MARTVDENGYPVYNDALTDEDLIKNNLKKPNTPRRVNVLIMFDLYDEPNEVVASAVEIDGCTTTWRAFAGYAAKDIYDLLTGKTDVYEEET